MDLTENKTLGVKQGLDTEIYVLDAKQKLFF